MTLADCTVVNVNNATGSSAFNLNTVNGLHSFIKETYNHYRGVATKYITVGSKSYWHGVRDLHNYRLVTL